MSIEVRVDGALIPPSAWHFSAAAGPLGISFAFPLPVGAKIEVIDTGPPPMTICFPPWRYGDVGRTKGQDFIYVAPERDKRRWHEVIFLDGASRVGTGTIPDASLINATKIEVEA